MTRHPSSPCLPRPPSDPASPDPTHLAGEGRELEDMEGLVKDGRVVGDVDKHGDLPTPDLLPLADEVVLEELSQLAVSEGDQAFLVTPTQYGSTGSVRSWDVTTGGPAH